MKEELIAQVRTRFAPTVSGELHLGSLWNALLNYLYAKSQGGKFYLRLDGQRIKGDPRREKWFDSIRCDLEWLGLKWDGEYIQKDRIELYTQDIKDFLNKYPDKLYFCNCTADDITRRARDGSPLKYLLRPEKYPPLFNVSQIKVFSGRNLIEPEKVFCSSFAQGHDPDVVFRENTEFKDFWKPYEIGYMGEHTDPFIGVFFKEATDITGVSIRWHAIPLVKYIVEVFQAREWNKIIEVTKNNPFCVEIRSGVPFEPHQEEIIHFPAVLGTGIRIIGKSFPFQIRREYYYDSYCSNTNKKLSLDDPQTVIRVRNEPRKRNWNNFVSGTRAPLSSVPHDVAIWFDGQTDLVLTGLMDDKRMGITHIIRGRDLYPFFLLENQAEALIQYPEEQRNITFHSMVVDKRGVKFSKFVNSTPLREYGVTPQKLISYLAFKGGLIGSLEIKDLEYLANTFDFEKLKFEDIVIDEKEMLKELED